MSNSSEYTIKTVGDFLEIIQILVEQYPKNLIVNTKGNNFVFRGISNIEYDLLPSVYREQSGEMKSDFTPVPHGTMSADIITNRAYLYSDEDAVLDDFIREATPIIRTTSMNRLKWIEVAQHYGAPTKLLDWTENPLVALFFIVSSNREKPGRLWLLHKNNYKEFLKKNDDYYCDVGEIRERDMAERIIESNKKDKQPIYPFIYHPDYLDDRMAAQSSCFMVWGKNKNAFEKMVSNAEYMKLDKSYLTKSPRIGKQEYLDQFLMSVTIEGKYKIGILDELRVLGIHEKSIFPGLDGVGKYVERFHRNDIKYSNIKIGTYTDLESEHDYGINKNETEQ